VSSEQRHGGGKVAKKGGRERKPCISKQGIYLISLKLSLSRGELSWEIAEALADLRRTSTKEGKGRLSSGGDRASLPLITSLANFPPSLASVRMGGLKRREGRSAV